MSTEEDTSIVTIAAQAKTPKLSADIIYLIIEEVDEITQESPEESRFSLRSCAQVGRDWRHSAQRFLHRVIWVSRDTYKSTLSHYSAMASIKDKQVGVLDGQIWKYPKVLIIEEFQPVWFLSWAEVPEFQEFAERYAQRITLLDLRTPEYRLDTIFPCITLFPSLRRLDLLRCDFRARTQTIYAVQAEHPAAPCSLRRINLTHEICCGLSTPFCPLESLAQWLRKSGQSDLQVALFRPYHMNHKSVFLCKLMDILAGYLRHIYLRGEMVNDDNYTEAGRDNEEPTVRLYFPDLSLCDRLETIFFSHDILAPQGYASHILSSITSQVLSSILFRLTYETVVDEANKPAENILKVWSGLVGLGQLLSCHKKFPALKYIIVEISLCDPDFKKEVARALLSKELDVLTRKRGIVVEYIFFMWGYITENGLQLGHT